MKITTICGDKINLDPNNVIWVEEKGDGTFYVMLRTGHILNTLENPFEYIPPEYEALEYIRMTGHQYAETLFAANEHSIFKITADIEHGATGTSVHDGTSPGLGAKTIVAASYNGGGSGSIGPDQVALMYNEGCYGNPILYPKGKHTYTIDYHNGIIGWDDNYEPMGEVKHYSQNLPFMIGAWYEGGDPNYEMTGNFYSLEVFNGLEQLVKIIPVLRKSDNTPGFLDITKEVSTQNPFMTNKGSGKFGYKKKDGTIVDPE